MRFIYLSILLIGTVSLSNAQDSIQKKQKDVPDTNFIISYPQYISLGVYTASPLMQIVVDPINNDKDLYKSDFKGNFSDLLGFSLAYKSLYIHYAFKTPFGPTEDAKKGRSVSTGITVRMRKPRYTLAAEYRRYKGYYDSNAPAYNFLDTLQENYVRPDMNYKNIGVNGIYNFSWKKYSYNAPLLYIERQLKSRIGFLVKGGVNYTTIYSSNSTILSNQQTQNIESYDGLKSINALLFKVGPGVGLNLVVFKRFYFAFNYFIMGNLIEYTYKTVQDGNSGLHTNANIYTETATSFGYNSKRLYGGISFNGDINIMRIKGANVKTNFATASITVGYRFNAPKFLDKGWNSVNKKISTLKN